MGWWQFQTGQIRHTKEEGRVTVAESAQFVERRPTETTCSYDRVTVIIIHKFWVCLSGADQLLHQFFGVKNRRVVTGVWIFPETVQINPSQGASIISYSSTIILWDHYFTVCKYVSSWGPRGDVPCTTPSGFNIGTILMTADLRKARAFACELASHQTSPCMTQLALDSPYQVYIVHICTQTSHKQACPGRASAISTHLDVPATTKGWQAFEQSQQVKHPSQ